jgi:ribosomal protein S14
LTYEFGVYEAVLFSLERFCLRESEKDNKILGLLPFLIIFFVE